MTNRISNGGWLLGSLVLGAALLAGQPQSPPQPASARQQALEALADKLIAAPTEEARNALLAANSDLVTVDLIRLLANTRALPLLRAKTDPAQPRAIYEIALTIAERLHDKKQMAVCLGNIGLVLKDQGDYESSLDYTRRSMALYEELKDPDLASAYNNIGIVMRLQGNFRDAAEYYSRALKLREAQGDRQGVASASFNLGNAYISLGNQRLALEQYKKSMELSQTLGLQLGLAYNTNSLGTLYEQQGDYDLALSYYEQSLKLKQKAANQRELAETLINMSVVYHEMGKHALAHQSLERALQIKQASGDRDGIALALFNLGWMLREQGNYADALERDQASLNLTEVLGNKALQAETLVEMARVYYSQKDYTRALEFGQRASEITRQIGAPWIQSRALDTRGLALAALGRAEEARATFAEAVAVNEELRSEVAGAEEERADFLAKTIDPYQHMVQLLRSENKLEEALGYAERAKARVLLDVMRSGRVRVDKAMTAAENQQELKLENRLTSLNAQISAEKSKPAADDRRLGQLNAQLDKARLDYRSFQTSLYASHAELQADRGDMRPVSLADTASLLPDTKTALLEFVVADDKIHLFVLVRGAADRIPRLSSYTVPVSARQLTHRVNQFREQLATRDPDYAESAAALYRLLLHPARAALAGKSSLIIVPDGVLWDLPFQALQRSVGHHLLEDAAISYAPSLTVLREMVRRRSSGTSGVPQLLALGNPALNQQPVGALRVSQASEIQTKSSLRDTPDDLSNAGQEVAALSRLYGPQHTRIYTGAAATEHAFKAEAGQYNILHLATHGIFDDRSPMYSHLVLSESEGDPDGDGLLEAWEVINLDLKADLVVLSACETARGKASSGEGLIGMAWAFFVAGSPSLVASQWKVDSASTTDLMLNFHRELRYGTGRQGPPVPKAKALQQAALSLMKRPEYRHPFYWAGFVLIGDGM